MKLIRTYADSIGEYLPLEQRKQQCDEIYDELCEQLEEQMDTAEPSTEQQLEFLRRQPHPLKQARRFGGERYLIGPDYYLPYLRALKISTLIVAVIYILLTVLDGLHNQEVVFVTLGEGFEGFVRSWMTVVLVVTLVFIALERSGERLNWYENWKPEQLLLQAAGHRMPRGEVLFEAIIGLIAFLWWNSLVDFPSSIHHNGADAELMLFDIGPLLFWTVNALLLADIANNAVKLFTPVWTRTLRLLDVARDSGWIILFGFAVAVGDLVRFGGAVNDPELMQLQSHINLSVEISLGVAIVIIGWDLVQHVRRLLQPKLKI